MISPAFLLSFLLTTNVELLWNYWLISAWYLKAPSHYVVGNVRMYVFFTLGITLHLFTWHLICYCIALSLSLLSCFWNSYCLSLSLQPQTTLWQGPFPSNFHSLSQISYECWSSSGLFKSPINCLLIAGTGQLFLLSSI